MISQPSIIDKVKTLLVFPPEFDIPDFYTKNILLISSKNVVDSINYNTHLEWEPVKVEADIDYTTLEKIIKLFEVNSEIPYSSHNFRIELLNNKNIVVNEWVLENSFIKEYSFNRNRPHSEKINIIFEIVYNSFVKVL